LINDELLFFSINIFIWTLLGPILYLYITYSINPGSVFHKKHILHLIPLIIAYSTTFNLIAAHRDSLSFEIITNSENAWFVQVGVKLWQYTTHIYFVVVILKLIKHKTKIKYFFSSTKSIDFNWILFLSIGFAVYLYFGLIYLLFLEYSDFRLGFNLQNISSIILFFYVFGIGYFGYRQRNIFSENKVEIIDYEQVISNIRKKKSHSFSHKNTITEVEKLQKELFDLMKKEKPYLQPDLTLKNLSDLIEVSVHKLSHFLNEIIKKNFCDFINSYRVNEFKTMLQNPKYKHYTILAISYECGFNSKTTFYNAFKKITGITPTKYRETLKKNSSNV